MNFPHNLFTKQINIVTKTLINQIDLKSIKNWLINNVMTTMIHKNNNNKNLKRSVPYTNFIENYHGSNTVFLVGVLMSVVGFVFVTFTLMALCYRSVVVHRNFSLCLRLVERNDKKKKKKNRNLGSLIKDFI